MKRLKIVEQIIIVLLIAVVIPIATTGIIIANISQHSVRNELSINAGLMAQFSADTVQGLIRYSQAQLDLIASSFNYIPDSKNKAKYFNDIETKTKIFKGIKIVEKNKIPKIKNQVENGNIILYSPIDNEKKYYLIAKVDLKLVENVFNKEEIKGRNLYIFDYKTKKLILSNTKNPDIKGVLSDLNLKKDVKNAVFGKKKNTPKAYSKIDNPDWLIVIDTTKKITKNTISKARFKIILCLVIAALSIFIIVGLYTSYLYINIRQLFKGITAISKGNYDKKIHLIKSAFTPNETVFIAKEFNYMAHKIKTSYKDLKEKNKELERLNKFREDLINSTSHEFRTPLTSIIGYTSRLLRHDIQLDEKTKIQSLQVIKQQAQRLSKMVEDLLVIPELDSYSLKFNIIEVDLAGLISRCLECLNNSDIKFNIDIDENLKWVYADEYRLEQIVINLIDNAIKYSLNKQPIDIIAKNIDNIPTLTIKNKTEEISDDIKEKLFDKFIRVDSNLTRTTRGTGLGLYIVKGLAQAMKIKLNLKIEKEFVMTLKFDDYVK